MKKSKFTMWHLGMAGLLGIGCAALVAGAMPPGTTAPTCRYSIESGSNQWFNAECTRFYSCCSEQYGVDHGPSSNAGTYRNLGDLTSVICNGTIYTAAYVDGVCTNTGAYVGPMTCTVQRFLSPQLCL